jgi:ABC-type glycerol-3-phosphate transport system substrate-binding protein
MRVFDGGAVPMRKSTIASNPDFFTQPTKQYLTTIAQTMQRSVWFVPEEVAGSWNEALDRAAQTVLSNGVDPKTALERAQSGFNRANGY